MRHQNIDNVSEINNSDTMTEIKDAASAERAQRPGRAADAGPAPLDRETLLVAAVVAAGTDYCDLTGETQWMRRMIDAHQREAQTSGARVVHACGFDSIPSDVGV